MGHEEGGPGAVLRAPKEKGMGGRGVGVEG